jgi:hypothetical protein
LRERRHVVTAEGVKGAVVANNDNFVTCDLRAVAEALRRGSGEDGSDREDGGSNDASGARDEAKRAQRTIDVSKVEAKEEGSLADMVAVYVSTKRPKGHELFKQHLVTLYILYRGQDVFECSCKLWLVAAADKIMFERKDKQCGEQKDSLPAVLFPNTVDYLDL